MKPVGQLKAKTKLYCTICNCSYMRIIVADIYENNVSEIELTKAKIQAKARKPYTCKVCKSIENSLKKL